MCLNPVIIRNRKYLPNKSNEGWPPEARDERLLTVQIGCGACIECREKAAKSWRVRLVEEMKTNPRNAEFITLTVDEETLQGWGDEEKQEIRMREKIRQWFDNCRKKTGYSIRHFTAIERGESTNRIHAHSLMWIDEEFVEDCLKAWKIGFTDRGYEASEKTVGYITKYMTKETVGIVVSKGIGKERTRMMANDVILAGDGLAHDRKGRKILVPVYYRNQAMTDVQREDARLRALDNPWEWVSGVEVRRTDHKRKVEIRRNKYREYQKTMDLRKHIKNNNT